MRSMAFAAPLLLLAYGVLRWIDGLDGHRRGGPAWDVGHLAFLASMATFALLAVALWRRARLARRTALVAAAAAILGSACMIWVIVGDLSASFQDGYPLPGPLRTAGPIAFVLGTIGLLSLQVASGRLPVWSPMLFFAGYTAISIDLDLLPLAGLILLGALYPLAASAAPARAARLRQRREQAASASRRHERPARPSRTA
ncbi:hypothetical protein ACFQS1_27060 [Paractinoplanes rhizophilus]|uniref:Uncharacterized protein n=1 Tax=Paractinoplanes rhizophilus TaxID=1416877 RepID=A0ABW2HWY8_9ACTN